MMMEPKQEEKTHRAPNPVLLLPLRPIQCSGLDGVRYTCAGTLCNINMSVIVLSRVLRDLERDVGIVDEFADGGRDALKFKELLCVVAQGAVELPGPGQIAEGDGRVGCHVDSR
jgi:hypothetical protein